MKHFLFSLLNTQTEYNLVHKKKCNTDVECVNRKPETQ